jgi:hypothetical protein
MSDRRIPVMPVSTHAIAVDAWERSVRAEGRAGLALDEILEIKTGMMNLSGEIAGFATEAQRDRIAAQDDRRDMRRQINALTRAVREVRNTVVPPPEPGEMREPLETLPEIMVEVNRQIIAAASSQADAAVARHSDAKKLKRYNWFEKAVNEGASEAIKHAIIWILVGIFGWLAHDAMYVSHEKRTEPTPIPASHESK